MTYQARLPAAAREAIVRHALNCLPVECCGLLAVDPVGRLRMTYPLTNADPAPDRFTIAPDEHFGAIRHAERMGWRLGGVFHSHPRGPAELSGVDLSQPHERDWLHVVVGFDPGPHVRAWHIESGEAVEIPT